jgi:hypothetical protein
MEGDENSQDDFFPKLAAREGTLSVGEAQKSLHCVVDNIGMIAVPN